MSALISCIVPVYNGERYLSEALESIFAQSYRPLEVIVVDDGSTDNTPQVVARFKNCIRYLEQSNRGPSATRNLGVSAARGDFVAFLDPDDLCIRRSSPVRSPGLKLVPSSICALHTYNCSGFRSCGKKPRVCAIKRGSTPFPVIRPVHSLPVGPSLMPWGTSMIHFGLEMQLIGSCAQPM